MRYTPVTDYIEFGNSLIASGDLDPIYGMLNHAVGRSVMDQPTLHKFLVAYWCYYSAATAARIAESPNFYASMFAANAYNWSHGFERRHFRGDAAINSIRSLEAMGSPSDIITYLSRGTPLTFDMVSGRAQTFHLFGPWIAWKIADMLERVLHFPVDFSNASLGIYKDPRQGAALIATGDYKTPIPDDVLNAVVGQLLHDFRQQSAPPMYDRTINVQEVETVLCKFKANIKGHYAPYNDTHEIGKGLRAFDGESPLCNELLTSLSQFNRLSPLPVHILNGEHNE